jgi:hypothetical protein
MTGSLCGVQRCVSACFSKGAKACTLRGAAPAEILPRHFKRELAEQARLRAAAQHAVSGAGVCV